VVHHPFDGSKHGQHSPKDGSTWWNLPLKTPVDRQSIPVSTGLFLHPNGGCLGFLKPSTVSPGFNVQWIIVNGFVFSWGSLSNVYVSHKNKSKLKTQFSRKTLTTYTSATLSGICLPLYSTQKSINHWVPGTYSTHSAAISLSSLLGSTPKNMSHLFQKEFLLLKTKRT